jgi:molybdate transport system substrate-binding protein
MALWTFTRLRRDGKARRRYGVDAGMAQAAQITVMSSAATKEAYLELVPQFERASENKVTTIWPPSVQMINRLKDGEVVDLVIMAGASIDELIKAGRIIPDSRVDLARSGVGVAVRAGAPKPDIGSAEALRSALLAATSVGYSSGPSGVYLAGLFQRMGIADALKAKIRQVVGEMVGAVVARGEAEIGFQQVSELLPVRGIDFLGPLPAEIQQITVFSAGLHVDAREPKAAATLVTFLTSPAARDVFKRAGMEPG